MFLEDCLGYCLSAKKEDQLEPIVRIQVEARGFGLGNSGAGGKSKFWAFFKGSVKEIC